MSFLDQLLRRKSPPMIGLDVSSSSVKLVELGQTASGDFVLERFALEPFEKGWITDGQIEKFDEVAEAVRRVVSKSGTRTKQVVMAMPQSSVITKKIVLPAGLREEEMELQVESEANQYIPFSLDEVSLDFCVIGPSPTSLGDVEVLIAASRKEKVEDRVAAAERAGLKPVVRDVEAEAIQAARQKKPKLLVLDINFPPDVASGGSVPWDGFRIMAWLRRFADFKQTPVVLVSIGDPVKYARLTIASGATAFFHKQMKPEQLEIEKLRREVAKLKAERDILKKAAAYFARDSI